MKMPNGYGSVAKISSKSNRRNPYRVSILVDWTDEGKPIRKTIGYVKNKKEGLQMLADYHDKPFDLDMNNVSFDYLYNKFLEYKQTTNISKGTLKLYRSYRKAYNLIENKSFNSICREDLQMIIDNLDTQPDYKRKVLNIYSQMYRYAKGNNIKVGANVSDFVTIEKSTPSTKHIPFNDDEIEILWNNRDEIIDIVLVDIYTGLRPVEFFNITEIHDDYFITGSKTESGKNRVIPLNNKIKYIFRDIIDSKILTEISNPDNLYHRIKKRLKSLNLGSHSPYDCRHTFATLMSNAHADEHCIKLIMGHRISDLTKRVYTHKVIEQLINEVNKI